LTATAEKNKKSAVDLILPSTNGGQGKKSGG
jgi:hypothetical protein